MPCNYSSYCSVYANCQVKQEIVPPQITYLHRQFLYQSGSSTIVLASVMYSCGPVVEETVIVSRANPNARIYAAGRHWNSQVRYKCFKLMHFWSITFADDSVCSLVRDSGPCFDQVTLWYFESPVQECRYITDSDDVLKYYFDDKMLLRYTYVKIGFV